MGLANRLADCARLPPDSPVIIYELLVPCTARDLVQLQRATREPDLYDCICRVVTIRTLFLIRAIHNLDHE